MASKAKIEITAKDQTQSAFASASRSMDGLARGAGGLITKLSGVGVALGAVAGALKAGQSLQILDQLDELAEKSGIAVEELSALRFASEAAGTSQESLAIGLKKLSKLMAESAGGSKEAAEVFATLGVSATDASGKLRSSGDVLTDIAAKFASYEDGAAKSALAQKAFGKSGEDLIPLLNQGRVGIEALKGEALALGAVYDGQVAKAAGEFNDNLKKIGLAAEGAAVQLAGPLITSLAKLSTAYINSKKDGDSFFDTLLKVIAAGERIPGILRFLPGVGAIGALQDFAKSKSGPKTTEQIQAYVNGLSGASAGGGRGFVNPKVSAPVVQSGGAPKASGGGAKSDPLAEAKRYLESLQKQGEKLNELTTVEQALLDIQQGRLGKITPALQEQILSAAQLVDIKKQDLEIEKEQAKAADEAIKLMEKQTQENQRYVEQFESGYDKLQRQLKEINDAAAENPLITQETLLRANTQYWTEYLDSLDKAGDKVNEVDQFTMRAAENIQSQLGSNLADILDGNFKNIGDGFVKMINRMVAEAIAADLSRALLGDLVEGGKGEGLAGGLLKKLTGGGGANTNASSKLYENSFDLMNSASSSGGSSIFGSIGSFFSNLLSFDTGTDYVPQDMVAKIHKGERIIPAAQNRPGYGGVTVSNNFTISGPMDRRTQMQIAASAAQGAQRAIERNT